PHHADRVGSANRGMDRGGRHDGEFRYEGQPLTAICSLGGHSRSLYIGTLNKPMFVSLRLAYAVVPEEIVEQLANIRTQMDGFTPAVQQMTMSLFLGRGAFFLASAPYARCLRT